MESASTSVTPANCSVYFNACIERLNLKVRASVWPMSDASLRGMADGRGPKEKWSAARHFIFRCRKNDEWGTSLLPIGRALMRQCPRESEKRISHFNAGRQ